MAFRFIPREEKFFTDFQALADELQRGAVLLEEMLTPEHPIWDKADEIDRGPLNVSEGWVVLIDPGSQSAEQIAHAVRDWRGAIFGLRVTARLAGHDHPPATAAQSTSP